jgi:hypothetical protein
MLPVGQKTRPEILDERYAMPEAGAKSIRGPLRYDVETSSPQMEAGKKFSVTMQITNPYDVPVTIYDLNTQLPIELKDPTIPTDKKGFVSLMKQRVLAVIPNPGVGPRIEPGPEPVPALGPGDPTIELQPGNSTVRTFAIKTTSAIFFPPASYNLYLWIDYSIDGQRNKDSVRYTLNIRAPIKAVLYGSITGSVLGFVLRSIYEHPVLTLPWQDWPRTVAWLAQLFGSVLAAAIAVVAFARKKETQPILSVEDFWGGLFIGFLAGYTGKSFLSKITGS